MEIPVTTKKEPFIEFRYDKNGKLKLRKTSDWWGGKKGGFIGSDGEEGNTCPPDELYNYIIAFNERKKKEIEQEIKHLQKKLDILKQEIKNRVSRASVLTPPNKQ